MNELIKKLAEQATTEHTSYFDGRGNVTQTIFDKEMFARLIVEECAGKVDRILAEGGKTQGDLIREHFGV